MLVSVNSYEEEWRTQGRRSVGKHHHRSYGRVCLWLILECGHTDQRMVSLDRHGAFVEPKRIRCFECNPR